MIKINGILVKLRNNFTCVLSKSRLGKFLGFGQNTHKIIPWFHWSPFDYTYLSTYFTFLSLYFTCNKIIIIFWIPEVPFQFFLLDNQGNNWCHYQLVNNCSNKEIAINEKWSKIASTIWEQNRVFKVHKLSKSVSVVLPGSNEKAKYRYIYQHLFYSNFY